MDGKGVQAGVESLETRARLTGGSSSDAIYRMVADAVCSRGIRGARLVDVGCGSGALWPFLRHQFSSCCGIDAVGYRRLPFVGRVSTSRFRSLGLVGRHQRRRSRRLTRNHRACGEPMGVHAGAGAHRQTRRVVGRHDSQSTELVESRDRRSVPTRVIRQPDGSRQEAA